MAMKNTPKPTQTSETRTVLAILAAQADGLRSKIVTTASAEIDFLYHISDVVTQVTETVRDAASHRDRLPPTLAERCAEVAAANPGSAVDDFTFAHAQRLDLVRQMAELLAAALTRLATDVDGLNAGELAKLYVSDCQRRIHDEAAPGVAHSDA